MPPTIHRVQAGECINSIAARYGHFPSTIWDHPDNRELREQRGDPDVLAPGDSVSVPEIRVKEEAGAAGQRHCFHRRGVPAFLHLRIVVDGESLAGEDYTLSVDGVTDSGTIGDDGSLEVRIPPDARRGTLSVAGRTFALDLGTIDPVDTTTGQQARLNQLGFPAGAVDGEPGPKTESALRAYQRSRGLEETGQPDSATLDRLQEDYGS